MANDPAFKDELKQRRKALDLTQAELAHLVGCSIYTLQHIEEGSARPSRQLAELLAARLEVAPEERDTFVRRARVAVARAAASRRERAGHPAALEATNPYKGLRAFGEADAPDFFGREILSQRLHQRLGEATELARFLAVVGPSGAGKSSVVRAGLLPALRQHGLNGDHHIPLIADMTPGPHPFEELEAALFRVAANPPPSLLEQLRADERGLAAAITAEVAEQPGALPLMQYALTELYERRDGHTLTLAAYQNIGGVAGALARRAEALYAELNRAEQDEARQLFLRLVTPAEGVEDTRRRVPLSELLSATRDESVLRHVLDGYGRYRMLTFDRDPRSGGPTVELAHEALLHSWARLDAWLASVAEWRRADQERSFLVSGARLAQFAELAEDVESGQALALTAEKQAYVAASLDEQQRALDEEREQQARELSLKERAARQLRYLVVGLAVFLVVASALAAWAFNRGQSPRPT
jgi:transcriptional regulator with XRE-family HTH domain